MSQTVRNARQSAIEFTAKFGFITRDLFFDQFISRKRTVQYETWAKLLNDGVLEKSRSDSRVFHLTKFGRAMSKVLAAPARSIYFIEHDTFVARILFDISTSGRVVNYWTERDLRVNASLAYSVLGTERLSKYPDLVLAVRSLTGVTNIAFEVERTQKSDIRYHQLAIAYTEATKVGLVIYACDGESTRRAIENAFSGEFFEKAAKVPVTFLLKDFEKNRLKAEAKFLHRRMSIKKMILAALQMSAADWADNPDKSRIRPG